jgi:hypothetical protein
LGHIIKKNEMGRASSKHGGQGEVNTGFWWRNTTERDHLKDQSTDRIILKLIFRK